MILRKSFDILSFVVRDALREDPFSKMARKRLLWVGCCR
jgi:hypothetical protein